MADVLIDARIFAGGVNISGQSNKVELNVELDEADATVFEPERQAAAGWKARHGTTLDAKGSAAGLWAAGDPSAVDDAMWAALGTVDVWTVVDGRGAVGDLAWTVRALNSKYSFGGDHGKLAPFEASWAGAGAVARGHVAHPHTQPRTAAGAGPDIPLAGVPAGQALYAGLHVLSVAGTDTPTLSAVVESAGDAAFTAPSTRTAFAPAAGRGAQLVRVAGPITDTHFRVRWSVAGGSPSFLFVATLGVGI